jgi:hypothetical protein
MNAAEAQPDEGTLAPGFGNVECSVVPHQTNVIPNSFVLRNIIVAGRNWHGDGLACLKDDTSLLLLLLFH